MNNLLKTERVLRGNLQNLFTVLMALCDTEVKNQVNVLAEYKNINKYLDSMMLLKAIKKIVYTCGIDNLQTNMTSHWPILAS